MNGNSRRRSTLPEGSVAPLMMPMYFLLIRDLIGDGRSGLFYTLQRTYAELPLLLRLLEHRQGSSLARNEHADAPNRAAETLTNELGPSI